MLRIDAHHHLWRYEAEEFSWLEGPLASLRRDFIPAELLRETASAGVSGTVAVQARQTVEETDWLLEIAAANPEIVGVVGWLPLRSPELPELLERYGHAPKLRGLRHVVQGEPAGFMDDPLFQRGIAALHSYGLVYDILIYARQLQEATRLVDRNSDVVFVLDHIAKPKIARSEMQPWADDLRDLARRPNVFCKVSGMVTEADPQSWAPEQLRPYFDVVLEAFGPSRLLAGSDWPMLLPAVSYQRWWELLASWMAPLSADEQSAIMGLNAISAYGLTAPGETNFKHGSKP